MTNAHTKNKQSYPELVRGQEGQLLGRIEPDLETFRSLAAQQRIVPVTVRLLADEDTPVSLYRRLTAGTDGRGTFLLESAGQAADAEDSRWSIIGTRARAVLTEQDGMARWVGDAPVGLREGTTPVEALREVTAAFRAARDPHLPPFTGGLVGFVAYDAVRYWEKLENPGPDEIGLPDLSLLLAQDVGRVSVAVEAQCPHEVLQAMTESVVTRP